MPHTTKSLDHRLINCSGGTRDDVCGGYSGWDLVCNSGGDKLSGGEGATGGLRCKEPGSVDL